MTTARRKSNRGERDLLEKNANDWPKSQSRFGYEDPEPNQEAQPTTITH